MFVRLTQNECLWNSNFIYMRLCTGTNWRLFENFSGRKNLIQACNLTKILTGLTTILTICRFGFHYIHFKGLYFVSYLT